jgi:dTDP-4-dehydrorhamnose 3,5-epimerase
MGREICDSNSRGKNNMIFIKTKFLGVYIIEIEKYEDERGFFARTWDKNQIKEMGLDDNIIQSSMSYNRKKGTIRGMHYQIKPFEETKLVRCTKGKIFDVIIDLRKDSETFKKWISIELSENNHRTLYIPKGFAHGFQTLEDNTEIIYDISQTYNSEYSKGIRWNDKIIDIKWPLEMTVISKKDSMNPDFDK